MNRSPAPPAVDASPVRWLGIALLVVGGSLIALSFFLGPTDFAAYDRQTAVKYQQVADQLHALTGRLDGPEQSPELERELRQTRAEFDTLNAKLESARSRGAWGFGLLRYGGAALVCLGLLSVAVARPSNDGR